MYFYKQKSMNLYPGENLWKLPPKYLSYDIKLFLEFILLWGVTLVAFALFSEVFLFALTYMQLKDFKSYTE